MSKPEFIKSGNPYSPVIMTKARYLPVNEPINPNQSIGKSGGGSVKIIEFGEEEQLRNIKIDNIDKTIRDQLMNFIKHATVRYSLFPFTFKDENGVSHTVRWWNMQGFDLPMVKGGKYNVNLQVRDEI